MTLHGAFVPGCPADWSGPLVEVDRLELWVGAHQVAAELQALLLAYGLGGPVAPGTGEHALALLVGAEACAQIAGLPPGPASPVPAVPDLVAVVVRRAPGRASHLTAATDKATHPSAVTGKATHPSAVTGKAGPTVGALDWTSTWSDAEHAAAVQTVREAIARGELYQANVVGHRSAPLVGDGWVPASRVARLAGALYGGVLSGEGWAVGCASPEQLVRVVGDRVTTRPVKGTRVVGPGAADALRASGKDRAEHVMIVDLERNDLARVCRTGSVEVEELYVLSEWSGLWQAGSTVAGRLRRDVGVVELLGALAPGGSVTGAPKRAAATLLAGLEPVGRGPAMGALGLVHPGGLDLGLTIRTVALDGERAHLWAGGGITFRSQPDLEVAEAHAKAAPVVAALAQVRPSCS